MRAKRGRQVYRPNLGAMRGLAAVVLGNCLVHVGSQEQAPLSWMDKPKGGAPFARYKRLCESRQDFAKYQSARKRVSLPKRRMDDSIMVVKVNFISYLSSK